MRRNPRILIYSAGDRDALLKLEAATRAGALGVVDLAWLDPTDLLVSLPTLRQLARRFDPPFAVRVAARNLTEAWLAMIPANASTIIVLGSTPGGSEVAPALALVAKANRTAWAEAFTREAASVAEAGGATALIVAGHEAGGFVGDDSSFILMQAVLARARVPVYVRGGVGLRVAAGCVASGASGVVLDGSALMVQESSLGETDRARVSRWDGGETRVFGPSGGVRVRVHVPPGSPLLGRLRLASEAGGAEWDAAIRAEVGWGSDQAWPVGQDSALAFELARTCPTVGDLVRAVERAIVENGRAATALNPLGEGSPLAEAHGTRYPIVQGPMTRVSDVVEFAEAVAGGGALPFLALAMLRGGEVESLLRRAEASLIGKPWGVGLLGFVSPELRREQIAAVLATRPPFAVIAGGRPDQAAELDQAGVVTYLHVPSPVLMDQFVREGARRFVLEGRECGGHVGPRSSFVLWEQALDAVDRAIAAGSDPGDFRIIFAGGIHDARSARFVASMAAPVAKLGVKVGVLVGTAYLFTEEAVATGAIVGRYQAEALRCDRTVLLETGPGHEVRVAPSPFVAAFDAERDRLRARRVPTDEAREALEQLNAGRLRVATKGVERPSGASSALVDVPPGDQFERGIYMIGQVATLRDRVTSIAELHQSIAESQARQEVRKVAPKPEPSDIAIVGMSAILPGAGDVRTFWENTLRKRDSVTEVPPDRWDWRTYYDPDPKAPDKVVSKWGGFVPDVAFDPLTYGMPPSSLPSIEPVQLLLLEATRAAIEDAGYADRPFARERTAVVLGMGGGAAQLAMGYAFRSYLPMLDAVTPGSGRATLEACQGLLPEWTEDSFPGFLLNVAAGRVANRFDLGGANYTVDAACGSSLAAAALAVRELESGSADMVLLGGADTVQNPFTYLAFSKTQAFSPRGRCRPFDASADGIVISEGVAMVVLKRLQDAERDGDRIYSVIKGIGASSDGRARGLTAPNPEGQVRAVERAYAKAGVEPNSVSYVEAHGTGTAVGDVVEVNAISGVFRSRGVASGSVAIGSVKSGIGHTKCAAGLAGLINASLALHHRVFPPTIGVEVVNPKADLADGPFRVSTESRPWVRSGCNQPRRAGVSAFGFGGTNFHAVLEGYEANPFPADASRREWPAELFVWRSPDRSKLLGDLDSLARSIRGGARPPLVDLARAINAANPPIPPGSNARPTLAILAESLDDLAAKLKVTRAAIDAEGTGLDDPRGVFYRERPEFAGAKVAFLFPGQGSQSPGMLADLAMAFPEVHDAIETFDSALTCDGRPAIGPAIYPSPPTDDLGRIQAARNLAATDKAQPALGASSVGLLRLLGSFGIEADLLAGHSFGELVALHAAGSIGVAALARLAHERGRLMLEALGDEPGSMAAVAAGIDAVESRLGSFRSVVAVNENGPGQTVIAGPQPDVAEAVKSFRDAGFTVKELDVAGAFHTPLVARVEAPLARAAGVAIEAAPDRPVYSNLDARPHPGDVSDIAERVGKHAVRPVRFASMIQNMHQDGARVFIEVGPGSVLTSLVGSILDSRAHLAVACDSRSKPGIATLLVALARLAASGVPVRLDRLSEGRSTRTLDLANLPPGDGSPPLSATTWLVNGSRSKPVGQPEPKRLGQSAEVLDLPTRTQSPSRNGHHSNGDGSLIGNGSTNGNGDHPPGSPSIGKAMTPPKPTEVPASKPVPPLNPGAGGATDERVLAAFQETMRVFLDVQRSTMLAYLSGRSTVNPATPPVAMTRPAPPPLPSISTSTPPPVVLPPSISDRMTARPALQPEPVVSPALAPVSPSSSGLAPSMSRDDVAARLVEIVRDRTGYPSEMLGLDLDLEADLGIDSIKRVEILGSLRDSVASLAGSTDPSTMDSLSRAKTLGAIVDRVDEIGRRQQAKATASPHPGGNGRAPRPASTASKSKADPDPDPDPSFESEPTVPSVRRLVIESVSAPLASFGEEGGLASGGVVVVTDDGRGVGRALRSRFEAEGHPVVLAGLDTYDLGSTASVDLLLEHARSKGPIAAIVHALPLRKLAEAGLDPERWASRMIPEVKGLFLLAKGAANDLERASRQGGGALIAATAMGGTFGSTSTGEAPSDFFPGHGGVAGLVKTLAREWPGVRARVVDLDPRADARTLADHLADETFADDGWSEVGYPSGTRIRLRATPDRLDRATSDRFELKPGEPVVVTGGARGITAAVARELARRWRPTLLLVGRSPLPAEVEDPETAGIEATAELKAALLGRLRRINPGVTPADLDRAYRSIRQAREIRSNLAAIRDAGAEVEYAAADVRDANSLGSVLDRWKRKHGDPSGLIHGAGVIQDKLIHDKTLGSFDAVLGTKLDGALNLARLLNPGPLRFAALFSSIAGRFGNAGQSDYAAANEVLNKLALWLDRRWPGRVLAMNWGPWSGVGMVSDLEGHLGARGLGMIPPEVGQAMLLDELRFGAKGRVEVIAAGELGDLEAPVEVARTSADRVRAAR